MTRLTLLGAPLAVLLVAFLSHPAIARHQHHHRHHRVAFHGDAGCVMTNNGRTQCGGASRVRQRVRLDANGNRVAQVSGGGSVIGGRPAGCPHAYCGCGLRKYLGLSDKRLNLAWNWARMFPRVAGPRAGVAAVRHGHVMYIEGRASNGEWLVRDYNSGGGMSRVHVRSVQGYVFVNPRG